MTDGVEWRLRIYRVHDGAMAQWVKEWRTHVVPLRRRLGFVVPSAWVSEEEQTFVWLVGWPGEGDACGAVPRTCRLRRRVRLNRPIDALDVRAAALGDWETASRAYYESDERRAMDPDPARHLVETRELRVRPLQP